MSSPNTSPNKSFRSRMGGVMRRTSSVLAISRPSTPTPSTTPAFPDEPRRSSISKSAEGRKSTTSLTPSGATPPAPVAPPEPVPQLPPVAVVAEPIAEPEPIVEAAPAPAPAPAPEPAPAPAPAPVPQVITVEAAPVTTPAPAPTQPPQANGMGTPKAVKRLLPIAAQYQMYPSPIAESPAREAAAAEEEAERNKEGAATEPEPAPRVDEAAARPADAPQVPDAPQEEPAPAAKDLSPVVEEAEPAAYVPPPPMLDSSNPGAFTDEPLDMRPSEVVVVAEPVFVPAVEPAVTVPEPVTIPEPKPIPVANPSPVRDERAYFDLVAVGQVHNVGVPAASPESQTVVGEHEHEQEHALVEPYPYELRPEPAGPAMPVAEPVIPEERPRTTEPARSQEREPGKGWVSDMMYMPVGDAAG
ncbi:hypothetical protein DFH06DRAFT_511106 [Mycena polygramma]|nr:hypothetical protein DFH06DRAFT_511106 [Mycena polygramma]